MMRMIKKEKINGKTVIITEQKILFFFKRIRKFEAFERFVDSYWKWVELPNRTIVPDYLSFQLNTWNQLDKWGE